MFTIEAPESNLIFTYFVLKNRESFFGCNMFPNIDYHEFPYKIFDIASYGFYGQVII